jgi:hypothetical protein
MSITCTAKNIRRIIFSRKVIMIRHSLLGIPNNFPYLLLKDITTAELLIAARVLVTGKNKPVTGNHNSDGQINDHR